MKLRIDFNSKMFVLLISLCIVFKDLLCCLADNVDDYTL